ncbi:MAG: hypothetical protein H6728_10935 [Myxococcales bacterium]|nr:hypothetical protein [Myxococcales bacterium]
MWPWLILVGLFGGAALFSRWYGAFVMAPRYESIVMRACARFEKSYKKTDHTLTLVIGRGSPVFQGDQQRITLIFEREVDLERIEQGEGFAPKERALRQLLLEEGYPASLVDAVQIEWHTARSFSQEK